MNRRTQKFLLFLFADIALIALAVILSFLLRFDGTIPDTYQLHIHFYIGLALLFTIPLMFWRKLYSFTWAFVSLDEIIELFKVTLGGTLLFVLTYSIFQDTPLFKGFPRSIIILTYFLNFLFLGALRFAKRITLLLFSPPRSHNKEARNAFLIGAGTTADELIRVLQKGKSGYHIVGILDDNLEKHGTLLHGISVLGSIKDLTRIGKGLGVETIIIALSEDESNLIPKVIKLARKIKIADIKIIPSIFEALNGKLTLEELRPVRVEDLLGRKPAKIETDEIEAFLANKDILVTGAAGSIGSELCHQVSKFFPRSLNLLDYEESNLFDLIRILEIEHPSLPINPIIADIRNRLKVERLMKDIKPHIIFHAAAYKHVPLMEEFPEEAIMTNVFGTLWLAKAALKNNVEKFVLISTDKAVRPISIMGKTKKLAEMMISSLKGKSPTQFISVRFGNVLGSRGSVLPIFEEQLRRRLPLTVTHPKMTRFFMTAPEAALLVLEAAASGKGGEIFILDMGKPVKIVQLARELIRLSGLEPDEDIPIVYTKPRQGEKITEEVLTKEEGVTATRYQKIFRAKANHTVNANMLFSEVEHLKEYFENPKKLKRKLAQLVK